MTRFISIILSFIFLLLSIIHVYWALGGRKGKENAIPTKDNNTKVFSPGIFSTLIAALGLCAFGVFILIKVKLLNIPIPLLLDKYGLWIIAIIFLLRAIGNFKYVGFFKKIRHTKFGEYDTKYYSPLSLVISILAFFLELNT